MPADANDPQTKLQLRRIQANPDVSDADPTLLRELRLAGLIYTVNFENPKRVVAHLKERGQKALEGET